MSEAATPAPMSAGDVRWAAEVCASFLTSAVDSDWSATVPDLEFTVSGVVAHAAEGCLWYAIDLAAGGSDLQPVEHRVKADGANGELIDTLRAYADIVAAVIDASPATARGFHPMGAADASGFAAMACDEMLVHTDDAARGLGLPFDPPAELAASVLRRLFPWVTTTEGSWAALRWANGRIALGDRDRLTGWAWHCAPLAEWDGTVPTRPSST